MIRTIADFEFEWSRELESTQKMFKHLTNESLSREFPGDVRTLGRLAWHIVLNVCDTMKNTGLPYDGPTRQTPIPATAKEIFQTYSAVAITLLEQVKKNWQDATLLVEDEAFGRKWKRGATLMALILHQTHHRAQMTVLMRLAGLNVPGVYGPARQEWQAYGKEPPGV